MKFRVNDDIELVEAVRAALRRNEGYCPCKIIHIPENKCICDEFRRQTILGECHCGLYIKEEV